MEKEQYKLHFGNLKFECREKYDFKNTTRFIKVQGGQAEIITPFSLSDFDGFYKIDPFALWALMDGIFSGWGDTEIIGVPKPLKIVRTSFVYANTPLWTTFWHAWILPYPPDYYLAYLVSPRNAALITEFPVELHSLDEGEIVRALKIRELKEGYCLFCGTKLADEPDGWEWGLGHRGEPNIPVYTCPKCGHENYGFRIGNIIKELYTSY